MVHYAGAPLYIGFRTLASLATMLDLDSLSDDVFEEDGHPNPNYIYHANDGLNMNEPLDDRTPTPTHGYPGFKPHKDALRLYAFKDSRGSRGSNGTTEDGWASYRIEEDTTFDESVVHKVSEMSTKPLYISIFGLV